MIASDLSDNPKTILGHINRGIAAFRNNDLERARQYFAQALIEDSENELAWLWLAESSPEPGQKRYCLDRAVNINPDSRGATTRTALVASGTPSEIPPVIDELDHPDLPPSLQTQPGRSIPLRLPRPRPMIGRGRHGSPDTGAGNQVRRFAKWFLPIIAITALLAAGMVALLSSQQPSHYIAVAGPMSGPSREVGQEMQNAARLAQDSINRGGGPRIGLLFFDDADDPERATHIAEQIVADERIIGVVGHGTSTTTLAAAPIYAAANLPVVTSQATVDALTREPTVFRTIHVNDDQALILAHYLHHDLGMASISIVTGDSIYEQTLAADLEHHFSALGTIDRTWSVTTDAPDTIDAIVADLGTDSKPANVVLVLTEEHAEHVLLRIRRSDVAPVLVGTELLGSEQFAARFATQPEESQTPGFFTNGLYAVSPLLYDSVGGDVLDFADVYRTRYGTEPGWRAPKLWDDVTLLATAIREAVAIPNTTTASDLRAETVARLRTRNSSDTAYQGLTGPIFFDHNGNSPRSLSVGKYQDGKLFSTPTQYQLLTNPTEIDETIQATQRITLGDHVLQQYRVVYVGLEMIELRDLSTTDQTYTADFFIYFRYAGDDEPLKVVFTNAKDATLGLGNPITTSTTNGGLQYRLYRVSGTFSEPMDFRNYPWDQHHLSIRFQNPDHSQSDIVYVADPEALLQPQSQRLASGFDLSRPFNRIPSWGVSEMNYEQVAVTSTSDDYDTDGLVFYSEFRTTIEIQRDISSFLIKNLLPLALLTLVTYISIWFPASEAGARVGFAISALLSSSVMLAAIATQLPNIGYTVALEWGYYAYIGLSAVLVLTTILIQRSYEAKRYVRVRRLDILMRSLYPATILIVAGFYWWYFST